jgi:hypothetical protein
LIVIAYDDKSYLSYLNNVMKATYKKSNSNNPSKYDQKKSFSINKEFGMPSRKVSEINVQNQDLLLNILPRFGSNIKTGKEKESKFSPTDDVNDIEIKIADFKIKHYGYVPFNFNKEHSIQDSAIEERIFRFEEERDYPKVKPVRQFQDHIVIIGYQENLQRLLLLLDYHFCDKDIVIISNDPKLERRIRKVMRQFLNVYYIQCDPVNAEYLVYAGISRAHKCLYLTEKIDQVIGEDIQKILSFKLIDNFFQADGILELRKEGSRTLLGYNPIGPKGKIESEYLHPLFLSGNLIYTSQLEKLIATAYLHEVEADSVCKLIACGYDVFDYVSSGVPIKTEVQFPIIITVKIPKGYRGKEFCNLSNDLLNMDPPCLPLGIYLKSPMRYLNNLYQNRMPILQSFNNAEKSRKMNQLKKAQSMAGKSESNFSKRRTSTIIFEECYDREYFKKIHKIKEISYNDKASLNMLDITKSHLPIFITNPQPNFIIEKGTYVQLMVHHNLNPYNKQATLKREQISVILGNAERRKSQRKVYKSRREKQKKIYSHTTKFLELFQNIKDKLQPNNSTAEA